MSGPIRKHTPARSARRAFHTIILRGWQAALAHWQRRRMIAALSALDDRTLRDIGIPRADIERVVDGAELVDRPALPARRAAPPTAQRRAA